MTENYEFCKSIEESIIENWINDFFSSFQGMKKQISEEHITLFLETLREKIENNIEVDQDLIPALEEKLDEILFTLSGIEEYLTLKLRELRDIE